MRDRWRERELRKREKRRDERKKDFSLITGLIRSPSAMTLVQWKVLFQGSKVMQTQGRFNTKRKSIQL